MLCNVAQEPHRINMCIYVIKHDVTEHSQYNYTMCTTTLMRKETHSLFIWYYMYIQALN